MSFVKCPHCGQSYPPGLAFHRRLDGEWCETEVATLRARVAAVEAERDAAVRGRGEAESQRDYYQRDRDLKEELLGEYVSLALKDHPLPWRVERDWTWEVHDANSKSGAESIVMKCKTAEEAETLRIFAEKVDADSKQGKAEMKKLLAEEGLDI